MKLWGGRFTKEENQLAQRGSRIDIRIEGMVLPADSVIVENVADKLGLAHPPGRCQKNVALVLKVGDDGICFLFTVTEIRIRNDSGKEKRVHLVPLFREDNISGSNIQI